MGVAKVVLNGETLIDTTGKTVAADKMLEPYTALDKAGNNVTGSIATKTSSNLTVSGATVTAPAGFYASNASKSVASGSATPAASISASTSTPSAQNSKLRLTATISNTPQVSAGYVSSGTAGNTSVTVDTDIPYYNSNSPITVNGNTVSVPRGFFSGNVSKTVAVGTAGTPTATKGTVSNHQVSVTPSVTNTTGYITGGTKTGTAVTVTASELASGNKEITSNGTGIDVIGYSTVDVDVPSTDFIVTVSWNSSTEKWEPDCTYAEVLAAYNAGKTIAVKAGDNYTTIDGRYNSSYSRFEYTVRYIYDYDYEGIGTEYYYLTASGLSLNSSNMAIYPSGTITINSSGNTDVTYYETANVPAMTLPTTASSTASGTSKATITPSTSAQYINIPTGYNGTASYYKINAMTTMTLPTAASSSSSGTSKATITPSTSAQYINISTGYNSSAAYYKINAMTALTLPTSTSSSATSGYTSKATITPSTSDQYLNIATGYNSTASYYKINAMTVMTLPTSTSGSASGTNKATIGRSTSEQYLQIPVGYNSSSAFYTISATPNLTLPSAAGSSATSGYTLKATITPSTSDQYLNIGTGYNGTTSYYKISAMTAMTLPTSASSTSSGTSKATIGRSTSNQYINIPVGYNSTASYYTISAVANGTAGTPTATKGTVSNHQISITPSVTNTTGYITGSTKTGTAVTVTASELVSGTKSITANATGIDVTNYASVDVSVASTINNQNKTVTPTTSQQTVTADSGYTGLGTVTVESMPVGERGTPLVTRMKTPVLDPTQLTVRISDDESVTGLTPGYFDSFVYQVTFSLENKTVTPSTSTQTITPTSTGYYLDSVTVNPIPSQYIIPTGNIDITSSGTTTVTDYATATVSAMTLPTAPTTTYTGTKVGSNIGRSTSTRYINIPVGYNDTAKYYQISAVSNMTLPTATSTTHTGTAKATITPSTANQYLNIPIGYNTATAYYTIEPGMIYEEGTFTPSADISHPSITFSNTHTKAPVYACIFDISDSSTQTTDSISSCIYTDVEKLIDSPFAYNLVDRYITVTASFKTSTGGNAYVGTMNYSSDNTGDSSKEYPRFWATETAFKPWANSDTRYFRSGRTYKWFAVWR